MVSRRETRPFEDESEGSEDQSGNGIAVHDEDVSAHAVLQGLLAYHVCPGKPEL